MRMWQRKKCLHFLKKIYEYKDTAGKNGGLVHLDESFLQEEQI